MSNIKNQESKDQIEFSELRLKLISWLEYLKKNKLFILVSAIVGLAAGYYYHSKKSDVYTAECSFIVSGEESSRGFGGIASQFGIDVGGSGSSIFDESNIVSFFRSRKMVEKVLYTPMPGQGKLIIDRYVELNGLRDKWKKSSIATIKFNANKAKRSIQEDSLVNIFYKNILKTDLDVNKPEKKTNVMVARYSSTDQVFSKLFVDNIVKNVGDFYIDSKTKASLNNVLVLKQQTDSIKSVLNYSISGVAQAVDATPNANPSKQITRVPSQRKVVDAELSKAVLVEMVKNLELAKFNLNNNTPLFQIIDYPVLPLDNSKIGLKKCLAIGIVLFVFLSILLLTLKRLYTTFKYMNLYRNDN